MGQLYYEQPTAVKNCWKRVLRSWIAHLRRVDVGGMQKQTLTITSIKNNAEIAEDRFDPPAEIKELLDG